ncbi:bifunctional diaminohydroxyphosphoribosylaminopyrimidine deaminase/5-amino-6-(5-phosphoribosylamino)uracil reductase RibD [Luteimonas deserti]|uniref:Riboflavin biosynthesis protein RibD n=1 Tax=Luteimonas deserti TaxID=2752306 RepID=A0A7Z0QRL0_9GAMM|nr:bifunctional diaminohydroxyphosphoribosylaminopyrimidine deaminase/5-amino-6-(5-phosphoribosylamino)uracil reductase RibD [Luteimonas deserti]NYZ62864.1 bifunctional diaminohydroxyphosphoribosylaminopyrimidine deaminase/5-amino-6-(5-phosphoribosylamino)uracil reductase RibD [Luteimonas deserti]
MPFSQHDHRHMARALQLAERGAWTTRPNPMVGCVLARDDHAVGEGFHVRKGGPHAEVVALEAAGTAARGATAYVTLEPCAHTGSTGPCADALIAAGVSRVVAAMRDPFPQVDGAGFERLRAAGVEVASGLMEAQARMLNRGFLSRVERGRPWVRLKLACSLDGRTALANGESKWISGPASRADVMRWRARAGALLTGSGTVLADDPHLTVRLGTDAPFATPLRVVLDAGLATIARGNIRDAAAPTVYVHAHDTKVPKGFDAPRTSVARDAAGQLDLAAVLARLGDAGINEVQVEAGATLAGAFLRAGLVDELLLYIAPVLLGEGGRPLFDGLGIETMAQRLKLQTIETVRVGDDLRLLLRPSSS